MKKQPSLNQSIGPLRKKVSHKPLITAALLIVLSACFAGNAFAIPGKVNLKSAKGTPSANPTFRFAKVKVATHYQLLVSDSGQTVHSDWYSSRTELTHQGDDGLINPRIKLKAGTYQWWIRAYNSTGVGSWSAPGELDVQDPNAIPPVEVEVFESLLWVDPLALKPGAPNVEVSLDPLTETEGLGVSGVIVKAVEGEGQRRIEVGLSVPPGLVVKGARICYEVSNAETLIDEVRILQLEDPPTADILLFQDETDLTSTTPVCVDSATAEEPIDPTLGSLRLQLLLTFPEEATEDDCIIIHGLGLHVASDPEGPLHTLAVKVAELEHQLKYHTHEYLTGRGTGHNNRRVETSPPVDAGN